MALSRERPHEPWTIEDIRREFERYCDLINASDRKPTTKGTYIQHADRFVRWLAGEVNV
jgi:tryptophanase